MNKNSEHFNLLSECFLMLAEDACRNRKVPLVIGGAAALASAVILWERSGKPAADIAQFLREEAGRLEAYQAQGATSTPV